MEHGRATLNAISHKKSDPCQACGTLTATMYKLGIAANTGEKLVIELSLCVTCRSHVCGVFEKFTESFRDVY